jgi:hypothetical protein
MVAILVLALPAMGQMDVLSVLETRDFRCDVDTVRFVWQIIPDQVFYPDSFGGPAGVTDSALFTMEVLWFPPSAVVHYRVNSGTTRADTLVPLTEGQWYELEGGYDAQPRVKFLRLPGIEEGGRAGVASVTARPTVFSRSVRITVPAAAGYVDVRDCAGRSVRRLVLGSGGAVWNGADDRGEQVPPGAYLLSAGATGPVTVVVRTSR